MITNYNLIYEALDMRRLLLGAGGVGGALYGAHMLGDMGGITGAGINFTNQMQQLDPNFSRDSFINNEYKPQINPNDPNSAYNIMKNTLTKQNGDISSFNRAQSAGKVVGAAAGLGLGGAIGYGLTRAVVGPKPQVNNQQTQIK